MKVYIRIKQTENRKNSMAQQEFILKMKPVTLRELITAIVQIQLDGFNNSREENKIMKVLMKDEMENQGEIGRIAFGATYGKEKADMDKAIKNALLAYEDGLYRVFIGEKEAEGLDAPISIDEGEILTFIRLTMLTGRLW